MILQPSPLCGVWLSFPVLLLSVPFQKAFWLWKEGNRPSQRRGTMAESGSSRQSPPGLKPAPRIDCTLRAEEA